MTLQAINQYCKNAKTQNLAAKKFCLEVLTLLIGLLYHLE